MQQLQLPFEMFPRAEASLRAQGEIAEEIRRRPHVLTALAHNALQAAHSLQGNYLQNTAVVVREIKERLKRKPPLFTITKPTPLRWEDIAGEEVAFIDAGIGEIEFFGETPILLRVGTYKVTPGEYNLAAREEFDFYPVVFGNLEGGSKHRRDFPDVVRIMGELFAVWSTLIRHPNLRVLMLHGPLVYRMSQYAGHEPFTERDIDLFLSHYAPIIDKKVFKQEFQEEARRIYPSMSPNWRTPGADDALEGRYEILTLIRFLLKKIMETIRQRTPRPWVCGVTERSRMTEFASSHIFAPLLQEDPDIFNNIFGRKDLNTPQQVIERLRYHDALLLALLLEPGQMTESFRPSKYQGMPKRGGNNRWNYTLFSPGGQFAFPNVRAFYVQVSDTTFPIRIEIFEKFDSQATREGLTQRVLLYASLLPGYAFPVGLDIVDKFARVPRWMVDAYNKIIREHLWQLILEGRVSEEDFRRLLVQALTFQKRDWLFRPQAK